MREQIRYRINHFIRVPEVQLIDELGKPRGIVPTWQALKMAQEAEFDLVEVNPSSRPPIAKIMDFGQFQYKQQKLQRAQKVKAKKVEVKGIRISFKIGEHDKAVRLKQAAKFLDEGHKVRVEMVLRGREKSRADMARESLIKFIEDLGDNAIVEVPVSRQGGRLSMQIGLKKGFKSVSSGIGAATGEKSTSGDSDNLN